MSNLAQMTREQLLALPPGTPLIVTDESDSGFTRGEILLFLELSDVDSTCLDGISLDGEQEPDWLTNRFDLFTLDRPLVVESASRTVLDEIQRHALANGWRWVNGSTDFSSHRSDSMVFYPREGPRERIFLHNASPEARAQAIVINADTGLPHLAAIKILLAGPASAVATLAPTIEQILSPPILEILRTSPQNPSLRGLIRAHTSKAVPVDVMSAGTEAVSKWLVENCKAQPNLQPIRAPAPAPQPAPAPGTVIIPFTIVERVEGSTYWVRTDTHTGNALVPQEVVDQGYAAVREWVRNNFRRRNHVTNFDTDYGDEDNGESSIQDTSIERLDVEMPEIDL